MATLRSFQSEIDQIHHREVAKQRALASEPTKDVTKPHHSDPAKQHQPAPTNGNDAPGQPAKQHKETSVEDEAQILKLLASKQPKDHTAARDGLAALITTHHGEYIFRIGARPSRDHVLDGTLSEATKDHWSDTQRTTEEIEKLHQAMKVALDEVGGKVCVLFESKGQYPRATLLLRLPPLSVAPEVRCAVVGNVDSGKSTTLGVLTRGLLDDGRGRARVGLFRHRHELETGRTSSVGMEILGFDAAGNPILPASLTKSADPDTVKREKLGWDQISKQAAKIVSFSDLAGHERYLKTTLYGLTSGAPSCVILMVGANAGLIGMSKEHLAIALALGVPVVVCISKIDMTPDNVLQETVKQVSKILKSPGCRKTPIFVKCMETAIETASTFAQEKLCPIFQLSNVTGEGLDYLRTFLNLLPSSEGDEEKFSLDQPLEYSVTEVWSVPYVGTVTNGILNSGTIKVGDQIMLGPDYNGNFLSTSIRDMQRKKVQVKSAEAGQCVSLALKRVKRAEVRKGMVIVHKGETPPRAHQRFEAQVLILYHNTTMQTNYQAMLHCGAVRQTVRLVKIDDPKGVLRTGDRATVTFEFITHPEYIKTGMKLLFRESKTKGLGVITKLIET